MAGSDHLRIEFSAKKELTKSSRGADVESLVAPGPKEGAETTSLFNAVFFDDNFNPPEDLEAVAALDARARAIRRGIFDLKFR